MYGAIMGDIAGSIYEFWDVLVYPEGNLYEPLKSKGLFGKIFTPRPKFTDDTVLTVAVAKTILETNDLNNEEEFKNKLITNFRDFGRRYNEFVDIIDKFNTKYK